MKTTCKYLKRLGLSFTLSLSLLGSKADALSDSEAEDQSYRLYQRITGVAPSPTIHAQMKALLLSGDVAGASFLAMESLNFYKLTIKNMFDGDTNTSRDTNLPLNDVTATVIGLIYNNERFDQILNGTKIYTASDELQIFEHVNRVNVAADRVLTNDEVARGCVLGPRNGGQILFCPAPLSADVNADYVLNSQETEAGCSLSPRNGGQTLSCPAFCINFGQPLTSSNVCNRNPLANRMLNENLRHLAALVEGRLQGSELVPPNKVRPLLRAINRNASDIRYDRNTHYVELERKFSDYPTRLVPRNQEEIFQLLRSDSRVSADDVMGLITLRGMASANFEAGTNRRVWAQLTQNFLCKPLEDIKNPDIPELRIRRDVDRLPGGSSANFKDCRSCHSGMDALVGAFTYFNFADNRLQYSRAAPSGNNKLLRQFIFDGHTPINNSWINLYAAKNAQGRPYVDMGWKSPTSGQGITQGVGAKALGQVLAATDAFSQCMAKRVFKRICLRDPVVSELNELNAYAKNFESGFSEFSDEGAGGPYNMKSMFAKVSSMCFGR